MERQRSHGVPGTAVVPLGIVQSPTFLIADPACLLYGDWAFTIGSTRMAPRYRRSLNATSGHPFDRDFRMIINTTLSDGAGSQRGSWLLRRDDGGWGQRNDDQTGRCIRPGDRPIGLSTSRASQGALQDDPRESQKSSRFNQSPFFLAFLKSGRAFERTLWTDGAPRPAGRRHRCQACWQQGRDQAGIEERRRRRRRLTARPRGVLI